jgi:hypothetical protein
MQGEVPLILSRCVRHDNYRLRNQSERSYSWLNLYAGSRIYDGPFIAAPNPDFAYSRTRVYTVTQLRIIKTPEWTLSPRALGLTIQYYIATICHSNNRLIDAVLVINWCHRVILICLVEYKNNSTPVTRERQQAYILLALNKRNKRSYSALCNHETPAMSSPASLPNFRSSIVMSMHRRYQEPGQDSPPPTIVRIK